MANLVSVLWFLLLKNTQQNLYGYFDSYATTCLKPLVANSGFAPKVSEPKLLSWPPSWVVSFGSDELVLGQFGAQVAGSCMMTT